MSKSLAEMKAEVANVNQANGWFNDDRTFGEDIALIHSEVSEALEAYRQWEFQDMTPTFGDENTRGWAKPEGVGSEFADVLIRLLDSCFRAGIDLEFEYERKIGYNRTRGYKHGGKKL